ncbi:FAD-dependent oxidoreductase [Thioalkalivibrio sp. XN8]|uniref:NAD(P)/FAD-dependent oxidoreductase n=1 Tax=Thioalkalivibrio sp. XN8 TaxID=2712863 RepID=UPI0013EC148D|nr:FAD-dependent oxidoreductase [Thioalkalivibrio sp. XN8]NGP52100.1 FAD-dependent oxidoreductase [Thioalkalivibrio sp. XN8]
MQTRACDVAIIGGGIIGLACAWYLRAAGRDVVVLEREQPGAGASHGNCGTITPSHAPPLPEPGVLGRALKWMLQPDAPLYIPPRFDPALWAWLLRFAAHCNRADHAHATRVRAQLLNDSSAALEALIAETGIDCAFERRGLLYVFRQPTWRERFGDLPETLAPLGIRAEAWDGRRTEEEEPALRAGVSGGIWFPDDAHLRPERLVAGLARAVRAAGVELRAGAPVTDLAVRDGRIETVVTPDARWQPREVVLAIGAWSPRLARRLGFRLPIQPGKGYSMTFDRPGLAPRRALVLKESSVCVTTWPDGFRLGSTMEFSGFDSRLNPVRLAALRRAAETHLREPGAGEPQEAWSGWRPMTPDDIPVIGRPPGLQNAVVATGHGMLGMSMSAATGLLVRDILLGEAPASRLAPLAPGRFTWAAGKG